MKIDLSDLAIEIPCPNCGHKIKKTWGKLKTMEHLDCSACSNRFDLDKTSLQAKDAKASKGIADAFRTARGPFK